MRPLELTINGFRSYAEETRFDWRGRHLVGVVGPIGSGKSSILDAIAFALYGKTPTFAGGVTSDKSFNGVTEWAYGVNSWFEAGLYLPLYTQDKNLGFGYDGFKFRALLAVPNADDRTFVYGLGFELSFNAKRWDPNRNTSEFRPIIGWHFDKVDLIFNPILDTSYEDRKSTRLNSSHSQQSRMPSSA